MNLNVHTQNVRRDLKIVAVAILGAIAVLKVSTIAEERLEVSELDRQCRYGIGDNSHTACFMVRERLERGDPVALRVLTARREP